ncbi:hypothetical protein HCR_21280 [Hydrogenimonas cancrithermarum]|uniref:VWFA domain-containing protein n=2 Tax=Hydrogenimonas cancrithermarum TaxID=2993563 RepID=A0ABN6WYC5_9BACT|nr:hypothetical protein HCR_21280 [Hydrogenimonas cancrithermarum]
MFGTFAYAASPVTYDLKALEEILKLTDVGIAGQSTAIGEGIDQAIRTLHFGYAKEKVIVLLTDGFQNTGSVSVKEAVEKAKRVGVKIYTIGIGKAGDFDKNLLERIATETGGRFFPAMDASGLKEVFDIIDNLEPSPIRSKSMINRKMLYVYPLVFGMILLVFVLSFRNGKGGFFGWNTSATGEFFTKLPRFLDLFHRRKRMS